MHRISALYFGIKNDGSPGWDGGTTITSPCDPERRAVLVNR